jgi:hypothetical protein
VARTTEAVFVVRIRGGNAEWVNVKSGELDGKLIEVFGTLKEGDSEFRDKEDLFVECLRYYLLRASLP